MFSTQQSIVAKLVGENVGTVSTPSGEFELKLGQRNSGGEVKLSMLGYASRSFSVEDLHARGNRFESHPTHAIDYMLGKVMETLNLIMESTH